MAPTRLSKTFLGQRPSASSGMVTVVTILIIGVVSQIYWTYPLDGRLEAIPQKVFSETQYWRLFTATLIHSDWGHYLSNSYMLGILGFFVYGYFGVAAYPFVSFCLAGVVNWLALWTYPPNIHLLGASGWVYVLAGFWLTLYVCIERQRPLSRRLLRALGVGVLILFPTTFDPQVSYRTHLFGFLAGTVWGLFYFLRHVRTFRRAEIYTWEDPEE